MSEIFKYGIGIYSELPVKIEDQTHVEEPITSESTHSQVLRINNDIEHLFTTVLDDKFTEKHKTELKNVHVIELNENEVRADPIVLNLTGDAKTKFEHILIIANKHSQATIIENTSGDSEYRSCVIEIIAKEGAQVEYKSIQDLSPNTSNVVRRFANVHENAKVEWIDSQIGSKFTQLFTTSNLLEKGAECKSYSAYVLNEGQEFDIDSRANQLNEETKANINAKSVLKGNSKIIYRGLVHIGENAKDSEGYQQTDAILLNKESKANLVPNLEIKNPNVKCSHGATVGKIDKEHLFYLQSKGLNEAQAKQIMIEGFFYEILIRLDDNQAKKLLERLE